MEYISKDKTLKKLQMQLLDLEADQDKGEYSELCENRGARDALDGAINDIRAIKGEDVQPAKRGKWEQDEKGAFHHCSECESKTFRDVDGWGYEYQEYLTDYCFRCGARMDGSSEYKPKDGDTK